jgi:hypothetical protein
MAIVFNGVVTHLCLLISTCSSDFEDSENTWAGFGGWPWIGRNAIFVSLQLTAAHRNLSGLTSWSNIEDDLAADIGPRQNPSVKGPFESSSRSQLLLTGLVREAGLTLSQFSGIPQVGTSSYHNKSRQEEPSLA